MNSEALDKFELVINISISKFQSKIAESFAWIKGPEISTA